jgi:4-azaleucine resistance transporter AzlC
VEVVRPYVVGARAGLAFALPTFVVGISFGALARSLGWGEVVPVVASLVVFSASAQFGMASVLAAGGGHVAAVLAAALVNARYLPMGIAVAGSLRGGRLRRALEGQAVVDASWALASRGGGRFDRRLLIGATIPQFCSWVAGTAAGVAAGAAIAKPERFGLDVVIPAFFLVLLLQELRSGQALATAVLAASVALLLLPLVPAGLPVLVASAAALIGLAHR